MQLDVGRNGAPSEATHWPVLLDSIIVTTGQMAADSPYFIELMFLTEMDGRQRRKLITAFLCMVK